jgi:hypothetical protein
MTYDLTSVASRGQSVIGPPRVCMLTQLQLPNVEVSPALHLLT